MADTEILDVLWKVIANRFENPADASYVSRLVSGPKGADRALEKVGEEATEFIIAVKNGNHEEIISEAADLQFHLLITLKAAGVELEEVLAELRNRRR
jgi:phosphoribosyl-ATP pyrophosphohydrolase